ncbi:MAG: response regulator [Ardenticatenaceae bacterium]|nr:response regulator [Ardenticatenaceae bacterium]
MTTPAQILIVEDESIVALDIQNRLRRLGYTVPVFVASGAEAITKTAEFRPDLILMDIKLKGEMDGVETARQIKDQFGISSIYLTAFADEATLNRARDTEPLGYLVKPFEERELLATIRMAIYRLQVERQLRDSEQKFRSIIEQAMDGIFLVDIDGKVIEWNLAQANITGITQENAVGRPAWDIWNDLLPDEQKKRLPATYLQKRIQTTMATGQLADHWRVAETEIQRPDGDRRILQSRLFLIDHDKGYMAGSVSRDITESKQLEAAMHQAQKIESLGILAGGAAHDFNNLLVVMLGQTSLALAKLPPNHPAVPHIKKAVKAAENASVLTQQMLAISGQGQFERRRINLNKLIEEELDLLKAVVPSHITLTLELVPALLTIEADRSQLQQILTNLVLNAAEAIGEKGGEIRIGTAVQQITNDEIQIRHRAGTPLRDGAYVLMTVADTGPGMSPEAVDKIFDPFFSTKKLGRGLGLSAVAGIVRGHQGTIWVDSNPGAGTIFSLLFPGGNETMDPHDAEGNEGIDEDSIANLAPSSARCVLVIDDQETVCEAVTDILELEDIPVLTAFGGQEGIEIYRQRQAEIGLILLDLSMPGMNGHETYKRLLEIDPHAPVVLSSGYDEKEVLKQFDEKGLVGFLKKPYNLKVLIETVKQHMGL